MTHENITIRPLEEKDLDWVHEVYSSNHRQALSEEERTSQGFLQGNPARESLSRWLGEPDSLIAVRGNERLGFTMLSEPHYAKGAPGEAVRVARENNLGRFVMYGPVAVAREARGQGIMRMLWEAARERAGRDFDEAIGFVEKDNQVSSKVHQALGFTVLGEFTLDNREYVVIHYPLSAR